MKRTHIRFVLSFIVSTLSFAAIHGFDNIKRRMYGSYDVEHCELDYVRLDEDRHCAEIELLLQCKGITRVCRFISAALGREGRPAPTFYAAFLVSCLVLLSYPRRLDFRRQLPSFQAGMARSHYPTACTPRIQGSLGQKRDYASGVSPCAKK